MRNIRDTVEEKIREYSWEHEDDPVAIKLDTYSLAMLREELGLPIDRNLQSYHGLKIVVDPDLDSDLVEII